MFTRKDLEALAAVKGLLTLAQLGGAKFGVVWAKDDDTGEEFAALTIIETIVGNAVPIAKIDPDMIMHVSPVPREEMPAEQVALWEEVLGNDAEKLQEEEMPRPRRGRKDN